MTHRIEQRQTERFRLEPMLTSVEVTRAGGMPADGHAYDISETGLRFELDEPVPAGEFVSVTLQWPGAGPAIQVDGEVVWVHLAEDDPGPRRMGVRFTSVEPAMRARLRWNLGMSGRRLAA